MIIVSDCPDSYVLVAYEIRHLLELSYIRSLL
jgi:hypothetical protein